MPTTSKPDLTAEQPLEVTCRVVNGVLVTTDQDCERMEANRQEVAKRHPELVRRARTEEERTLLIAKKAFAHYGDRVIYESRNGEVVVHLARFSIPQHRGTTRAVRSTRRVRTSTGASSGADPPQPRGTMIPRTIPTITM